MKSEFGVASIIVINSAPLNWSLLRINVGKIAADEREHTTRSNGIFGNTSVRRGWGCQVLSGGSDLRGAMNGYEVVAPVDRINILHNC